MSDDTVLTHWGLDKMVAISQTVFSHAFSWMKTFECQAMLYQMCSLGSNWRYVIIGPDNGLAPNRRQAIIWTNDGLFHWCITHICVTRPRRVNVFEPGDGLLTSIKNQVLAGHQVHIGLHTFQHGRMKIFSSARFEKWETYSVFLYVSCVLLCKHHQIWASGIAMEWTNISWSWNEYA